MSTPSNQIPYVPQNVLDPAAGINNALDIIDALLQTAVISMSLSAPPGSPADGDMYIPAATATGAWTGLEDKLVRYRDEGTLWQSYTAHMVLNLEDGALYAFIESSAGNAWVPVSGTGGSAIAAQDDTTGGDVVDPVTALIFGDGLRITDLGGGVALIERAAAEASSVITDSTTNRNASPADAETYVRFTNASAKTYTFNNSSGFTAGQEFNGRNAGAGNLTITAAGSMVINAPAGGTLVVPQNGTFTVKIISSTAADLIGATT